MEEIDTELRCYSNAVDALVDDVIGLQRDQPLCLEGRIVASAGALAMTFDTDDLIVMLAIAIDKLAQL